MDREQLTEQALAKAMEWASAAEGFVAEQAPELCREIVMLGRGLHTTGVVVGLLLFVVAWAWWSKTMPWAREKNERVNIEDKGMPYLLPIIGASAIVVAGLIFVSVNTYGCAKVWLAPRLYVLEVLRGLL